MLIIVAALDSALKVATEEFAPTQDRWTKKNPGLKTAG
jgi:hypothetical protein